MKHKGWVILALVVIFFLSQIVGLYVTSKHSESSTLPLNIEKPKVENKSTSFISIAIFIIIATALGLLLIKFNLGRVWKVWFFFGIFLTLVISLSAFIDQKIAIIIALSLALIRILKDNVFVHNFTEIFIYGAMSAILSPILNIFSAFALLFVISIYDYIAVYKTKHMVKLAKFQSKSKHFAGLMIPYSLRKSSKLSGKIVSGKEEASNDENSIAILGGGDIGFPLMFASVVMLQSGLSVFDIRSYIIPVFATISLTGLFIFGSSKKFYPAMPYLTAGCTAGYLVLMLFL